MPKIKSGVFHQFPVVATPCTCGLSCMKYMYFIQKWSTCMKKVLTNIQSLTVFIQKVNIFH